MTLTARHIRPIGRCLIKSCWPVVSIPSRRQLWQAADMSDPAPPTEQAAEPPATEQKPIESAPAEQPAAPIAASEVLNGKETEQSNELKRQLERRDQELKSRELTLAARERKVQRQREELTAPEKKSFLSGNALFD